MGAKEYEILIQVSHVVYVEAESLDEAEELALDAFADDVTDWDDLNFEVLDIVDLEDGSEEELSEDDEDLSDVNIEGQFIERL